MKKILIICAFFLILTGINNAEASFTVDWGNSWDGPHDKGYDFLGRWLYTNGYFSDLITAANFAKNNYTGKNASDPDAFYFNAGEYAIEIVYENAGFRNKNKLGYYTDDGKFQIFAGPDGVGTPSKTINPDEACGFYLYSNYKHGTYWYTDRFDNTAQSGKRLAKNNPQALIYELKPNQEWLIAWEDLDSTQKRKKTDNDYNDMYVLVTNTAIPEPASMALLGLGLAGLLKFRRKSYEITR